MYDSPTKDAIMYARIGQLITNKFKDKIHEPTIVEDIMGHLHSFEKDDRTEEVVRVMVGNRLLVATKFKD